MASEPASDKSELAKQQAEELPQASSIKNETTESNESKEAQSTMTTTPFEQAIKTWSEISLSKLQRNLDDQGVEILDNQKKSLLTRKELATRTKTFRKLPDEAKITEIKGLLKLYQAEVDSLTQRSKFAETSFLSLYKLLAEAPDPAPLLEASVESVLAASEVPLIRKENIELTEKLSKYADYDQIKEKLRQVEIKAAEDTKAKLAAKESELNAIIDEKERHWKEREAELQSQVQEARDQIKELRSGNEVLQARLSAKSADSLSDANTDKNLAKTAGRIAELELVASDLERANKRMLEVEKRNIDLRSELEAARSGTKEADKTRELESRLSDLERENSLLVAKLESARMTTTQTKAEYEKKLESLKRELDRKDSDNDSLRQKISSMKDYSEIKKELEILKSVEFAYDEAADKDDKSDNEDDEELDDSNFKDIDEHNKESQSLERLMLARNKKLDSDITQMRVAMINLENELSNTRASLDQLKAENDRLTRLNSKLEDDLAHTNDTVTRLGAGGPAMSVVSGWGRSVVGGSRRGGGRLSPTASIVGGYEPSEASFSSSGAANSNNSGTTADASILPIITQQRDRFRARNTELEDNLRKSWNTISQLRKELESIKKDNLELYQKARYASSYTKSGSTSTNTYSAGSRIESNYKNLYEDGLSPFQKFKDRESERALSKMGTIERALYSLTRTILVNRTSRNLFAGYCLALHLLVMTILMYNATWHTGAGSLPSAGSVVEAGVSTGAATVAGSNVVPDIPEGVQ